MSEHNPYLDYDPIDPYSDDDDTGNFSFVEDEYDSMGYAGLDDPAPRAASLDDVVPIPAGSTEEFPRTQVRQPAVGRMPAPQSVMQQQPAKPKRGLLRRRKDKRARAAQEAYQAPYVPGYEEYAPAPPRPARPARPPRRRRRHRSHGCLTTLLVLAVACVGVYWALFHPIDERLAFTPAEQETVDGSLSWSVPGLPYYVLALGSDARSDGEAARTDTMVLVRVDIVGGKITMLSIPRDTKVEIEGHGTQKINAAYAFGGVGGAARAVSELCGVPVNHVALVRFEQLVGLVDYLGGVTVNVPVGVNDPMSGLVLSEGVQTLDGQTALLWARSRYGYERGDFQRQDDQRILITAIINRMLSLSPSEVPGALEQVGDFVGTDMRCYNLIPLFVRLRLGNPRIYSASIPSTTAMVDGVSYVIADQAALAQMMQAINAGGDPSSVG